MAAWRERNGVFFTGTGPGAERYSIASAVTREHPEPPRDRPQSWAWPSLVGPRAARRLLSASDEQDPAYEPVDDADLDRQVEDLPGVRSVDVTSDQSSPTGPSTPARSAWTGASTSVGTLDAVAAILWQGDPLVRWCRRREPARHVENSTRSGSRATTSSRSASARSPATGEVPADAEPLPRPPLSVTDRLYRGVVGAGRVALRALDLRVELTGDAHVPRQGPVVLAANHVSFLDFLLVGLTADRSRRLVRFLARQEVFEHWASRRLMTGMGHVPVDRRAPAAAYLRARQLLREGEAVGVFPEAGVSRSWSVRPSCPARSRWPARPAHPCCRWSCGGRSVCSPPSSARRYVEAVPSRWWSGNRSTSPPEPA